MKKLTSYRVINTGEGPRLTFTYSEVDEHGIIISQNNMGPNILLEGTEFETHTNALRDMITKVFLSE